MLNTIAEGQTLKARCITDANTTFTATVTARKGTFATIKFEGETAPRRVKVREYNGREYVMPGNYSMAPAYYPHSDGGL